MFKNQFRNKNYKKKRDRRVQQMKNEKDTSYHTAIQFTNFFCQLVEKQLLKQIQLRAFYCSKFFQYSQLNIKISFLILLIYKQLVHFISDPIINSVQLPKFPINSSTHHLIQQLSQYTNSLMVKLIALLLLTLIHSCFGHFEFQLEQLNFHDVLLVSNSDILEFTPNNSLRLVAASLTSQKQDKKTEIDGMLLRKEDPIDQDKKLFILPFESDYEICISNQSKTLHHGLNDRSLCHYDIKINKKHQFGDIKFNKIWRQQSRHLGQRIEVSVDYSQKHLQLPKSILTSLISYLNLTNTNCSMLNGSLSCSNFTSKNYHYDEIQILIGNQQSLRLQLRDLVSQCYEMKQCSLWISESSNSQIKLGSILLKRYSTKFEKQYVHLASINPQRIMIMKHVEERKYEYLVLIGTILLGITYYLKQKQSPIYLRLSAY